MYHSDRRFEAKSLSSGRSMPRAASPPGRGANSATGGRIFERRGGALSQDRVPSATEAAERGGRSRVEFAPTSVGADPPPPESPVTIVQGLRLIGLSPREGKMFLALIRGPLGAREASELAGLHRATGYRVLLRLLDRGVVSGNGRNPQSFQAVNPAVLFRRLELAYRDETEIPGHFAEALSHGVESAPARAGFLAGSAERPRVLSGDSKSMHPALSVLGTAKRAVTVVVRPLSTPVSYRQALARCLGQLARRGVSVRLITDATPADYRFGRVIHRESGGNVGTLQVRHYCPLMTHAYTIDRERVIRLPTLGTSSRTPPVAILLEDAGRVRAQVSRFEGLWAEAYGAVQPLRSTRHAGVRARAEGFDVGHESISPTG